MYSETLIDHFQNPRNVGILEDADGYAKVDSPVCGDLMEIYIKVKDDKIADVRYRTFGCAAAIASSSMATEMVKGQPLSFAEALTDEVVAERLGGLPDTKLHCSVLAASALHAAIQDYHARHPYARSQDT